MNSLASLVALTFTEGIFQQTLASKGLKGLKTEKAPGQGGWGHPNITGF